MMQLKNLDGGALEIALTATNAAAQAWYGYDQVSIAFPKRLGS